MKSGLLFGLGAYGMWGMFPAFFPLLKPAGTVEVLAHRIIWSFLLMALVVATMGRLRDLKTVGGRTWMLLTAAAALISANWAIYVYAVNNGHVVDAALGYFISPLVAVALGLLIFGETLNRWQFAALVIAAAAVLVLTVNVGSAPLIGLGLALSFGLYGAVKKSVPTDPRVSVAIEAGLVTPFALVYVVAAQVSGNGTLTGHGGGHAVLMVLAGVLTALPLLLFAAAAQRLAMVSLGLLSYVTPTMKLSWGVLVGHEAMPPARWAGFVLIWVALALFTVDAVRRANVRRRPAEAPPV